MVFTDSSGEPLQEGRLYQSTKAISLTQFVYVISVSEEGFSYLADAYIGIHKLMGVDSENQELAETFNKVSLSDVKLRIDSLRKRFSALEQFLKEHPESVLS